MQIPKKIMIGTKEYSVEIVEALLDKAEYVMSISNLKNQKVKVAQKSNKLGRDFTNEQISDTFWYEVTRAILNDMRSKLYDDNIFVTGFSERLNKVVLTAKF